MIERSEQAPMQSPAYTGSYASTCCPLVSRSWKRVALFCESPRALAHTLLGGAVSKQTQLPAIHDRHTALAATNQLYDSHTLRNSSQQRVSTLKCLQVRLHFFTRGFRIMVEDTLQIRLCCSCAFSRRPGNSCDFVIHSTSSPRISTSRRGSSLFLEQFATAR